MKKLWIPLYGMVMIGLSMTAKDSDMIEKYSATNTQNLPIHAVILNQDYSDTEKINLIQKILDDQIVNIDVQDANGKTALNLAIFYKSSPEIIQCLIERGAKVDMPDHFNVTPLYNAIKYDQMAPAIMLLSAGADETWKADNGLSPINIARSEKTQALFEVV